MQQTAAGPGLVLDVGGTKIIAALIDANFNILARERHLTEGASGPENVLNRIFHAMDHLLEQQNLIPTRLEYISIAAAGFIDMETGIITNSPNLPGWINIPLRDGVQSRYGVPTYLINDARAAAIGEHRMGAGVGVKNLVLLTLGTGVGGGIIANDRLYFGARGLAGEVGHMTIDANGPDCACGSKGCLEALASGTAIARETRRWIVTGEQSLVMDIVRNDINSITSETVFQAAQMGDSLCLEIINWAGTNLGVGLVNLINIFNPEMIVLGGGMAAMGDLFLSPAREVAMNHAIKASAEQVKFATAQLGNDAGICGAAIFGLEKGVWR